MSWCASTATTASSRFPAHLIAGKSALLAPSDFGSELLKVASLRRRGELVIGPEKARTPLRRASLQSSDSQGVPPFVDKLTVGCGRASAYRKINRVSLVFSPFEKVGIFVHPDQ
jgi:hypothetical protein